VRVHRWAQISTEGEWPQRVPSFRLRIPFLIFLQKFP
jgi:hypothetical protein